MSATLTDAQIDADWREACTRNELTRDMVRAFARRISGRVALHPSVCQHGTPRRYACQGCEAALETGAGIEGLRANARGNARP